MCASSASLGLRALSLLDRRRGVGMGGAALLAVVVEGLWSDPLVETAAGVSGAATELVAVAAAVLSVMAEAVLLAVVAGGPVIRTPGSCGATGSATTLSACRKRCDPRSRARERR